jgi:hydroxypyruvate isomerase
MSTFKQSVAYWPLSRITNDDLKRIFEMGITGVEMPPEDKYDQLREIGFTIATIGGHKSLEDGLNKPENHSRIEDELNKKFEIAKKYEIPNLIVFSGNRNGKSEEEGAANTIEGLKRVAGAAEAAGVTLVLELLNSKVDHPDYQCDHTAWGVQVVSAVNSPRVKLLYDIYHMQIMEGDLIRNIRDHIEHIGHFHTAGNPGRKDLDDQQEIYYPAVAHAIHHAGYRDWVGHEFSPKGDAVPALQQAYEQVLVKD